MALRPVRVHVPIKGVNTITPIREMGSEYSPRLENVWFDQAGAMNRRPGQNTYDNAGPGGNIKTMFEHYHINGAATTFAWSDNTNVYSLSGATWSSVAALAAVFANRPTAAQILGQTIVGDGVNVRYFNGTVWATPATVSPMKFFTAYNGRMYGAGNPAQVSTVYFSDTIAGGGVGVADWNPATVGGFLSVEGALGRSDIVTGLVEYQGMLVVLCQNSIIFYAGSDPKTPSTFYVHKAIKGVGCISHDSIFGVGNEVIFLSNSGFKTLHEVLVQGDAATAEASTPIDNYVAEQLRSGNVLAANIRATYAEKLGVYLCTFGNTTLAYHPKFQSWTFWYGVLPTLLTTHDGTLWSSDTRLHHILDTQVSDVINGGAAVAIPMVWETAPFRSPSQELKARWNRAELIFEGTTNEPVYIQSWPDLVELYSDNYTYTLVGDVPITNSTDMLWSASASADPRRAWGTAATGPSWAGNANYLAGDQLIPIRGRSELISFRVTNTNISKFKITAFEVYSNSGGLRN